MEEEKEKGENRWEKERKCSVTVTVWGGKLSGFFFFFFNLPLAVLWLSLVAVIRYYSLLACAGFSLQWFLLWSPGTRPQAQKLWRMGLATSQLGESSWTRDRTRVPCIGRWLLLHWAREVPGCFLKLGETISLISLEVVYCLISTPNHRVKKKCG